MDAVVARVGLDDADMARLGQRRHGSDEQDKGNKQQSAAHGDFLRRRHPTSIMRPAAVNELWAGPEVSEASVQSAHVFIAAVPALLASLDGAAYRHLRGRPRGWRDEREASLDGQRCEAWSLLHPCLRPAAAAGPGAVSG